LDVTRFLFFPAKLPFFPLYRCVSSQAQAPLFEDCLSAPCTVFPAVIDPLGSKQYSHCSFPAFGVFFGGTGPLFHLQAVLFFFSPARFFRQVPFPRSSVTLGSTLRVHIFLNPQGAASTSL